MELCKNLYPCCCNSFCFSLPDGILSLNTIIKVFHAMKIRIICYRGWLNIGYLLEWLFDLLSYSRLWTFLVFQVILIWLSNQYPLVQDCATRNSNILTFNLQNSNSVCQFSPYLSEKTNRLFFRNGSIKSLKNHVSTTVSIWVETVKLGH